MIVKAPIAQARHCPCFICRGSHPPTLRRRAECRRRPLARAARASPRSAATARNVRSLARPAALRAPVPGAGSPLAALFLVLAAVSTLVFPVALQVADRPGLHRRRPGRARDGAARALLRPVRGRRRPRRLLGGALLHGELARRARHRRPAQRRLRARRPAEPASSSRRRRPARCCRA